jgi:hypothetical protein
MLINVGYEIGLRCQVPAAMVLMLYLHPSTASRIRKLEQLEVDPQLPVSEFIDLFGNRCGHVFAPSERVVFRTDAIIEDNGWPDPQVWLAPQHNVQDLPDDVLMFLLASHYCEVDSELKDLACTLFGGMSPGWPRVQSVASSFTSMSASTTCRRGPLEQHGRFFGSAPECAVILCIWRSPSAGASISRRATAPAFSATWVSCDRHRPWISVPGSRFSSVANGTCSIRATMCRALAGSSWGVVATLPTWH